MTKSISDYIPSGDTDTQTKAALVRILKKVHASPSVASAVLQASSQISTAFGKVSAYVGGAAKVAMANLLWVVIVPIVAFYALKDFHSALKRRLPSNAYFLPGKCVVNERQGKQQAGKQLCFPASESVSSRYPAAGRILASTKMAPVRIVRMASSKISNPESFPTKALAPNRIAAST